MFKNHDLETIIAQCTPTGRGAIALLRISGVDALTIATHISALSNNKKLNTTASHSIHYGTVVNDKKNIIDRVLFFIMHAPQTFTGQDTVEISCHNNPFIIQEIINLAIKYGARLAQEGEFTKRAVLNDKLDLVQAEAINDLFHAHTKDALKKSLAQLEGNFSHAIHAIEKNILKAIALCEASFEFIDEEITFDDQIRTIINTIILSIAHIKKNFDQQQRLKDGVRIAIIGSVNAGKSSLFNALLGKKRAIVTDIAGTTRDSVEAGVYRSDYYWTLIDTAGIRQTDNIIEQEGINRSIEQAALADVILLVFDHSCTMSAQEQQIYRDLLTAHHNKIIIVGNKIDLPAMYNTTLQPDITVSTVTNTNIPVLETLIEEKVVYLFAQADSPFLLNTRQFNLIQSCEKKLLAAQEQFSHAIAYELLSIHLNDALACLSELTGKNISEKAMDTIFKEFCIGK